MIMSCFVEAQLILGTLKLEDEDRTGTRYYLC